MRHTPFQTLVHDIADLIADGITQAIKTRLECSDTEAIERFQHGLAGLFPIPPQEPPSTPPSASDCHAEANAAPSPSKPPSKAQRRRTRREVTPEMLRQIFYEVDGHVYYRHDMPFAKADSEAGSLPKNPNKQCVIYSQCNRFHRAQVVFCLNRGRWPEHKLFHRNFDRRDDRDTNLVEATHAEICRTTRCSTRNVLGVKGVAYDPGNGQLPYRSRIVRNGIKVMLGSYATASEAHQAYCNAANELHGRFNPASSIYQPTKFAE